MNNRLTQKREIPNMTMMKKTLVRKTIRRIILKLSNLLMIATAVIITIRTILKMTMMLLLAINHKPLTMMM